MKVKRIGIAGLRGVAGTQTLDLKGKSVCLLGGNGRGKSSVADALEFFGTGSVEWTRRHGVGLSALIHLAASHAEVTVQADGHATGTRRLSGIKAGPVEYAGPTEIGAQPEPVPIMRHRTMADFVHSSAADKRTALLTLLGLEPLNALRAAAVTTANNTRRTAAAARADADRLGQAARDLVGEDGILSVAAQLARTAGYTEAVTSEAGLAKLPTAAPPAPVDKTPALDSLERTGAALAESSTLAWDTAVAAHGEARDLGLAALLAAGQEIVPEWPKDECPLCLQVKSRAELADEIGDRASALAVATAALDAARSDLAAHQDAVIACGRALAGLLDDPTISLATELRESLDARRLVLRSRLTELRAAGEQRRSVSTPTITGPSEGELAALRTALKPRDQGAARAAADLIRLRNAYLSHRRAEVRAAAEERVETAARRLRELVEEHVRHAIETALRALNDHIGRLYATLIGFSVVGDVRLEYTDARAGGIEFFCSWDGKVSDISPPQRIMSESQLNALGLALFFARLLHAPGPWRTVVLDDVVNSFDADHRLGLTRLLGEEFSDWQVILLTHDEAFARAVEDELTGWKHLKIVGFTPSQGPIIGAGEARKRLRQRLEAGEAASELGGLARQALESALDRPLLKLGLPIRRSRADNYTARELLDALSGGLQKADFPGSDAAVFKRMKTDGSMTNRLSHDKPLGANISESDLHRLLTDLDDLDAVFKCAECGTPAWALSLSGSHCRCSCGYLAV